MAGYCEVSLNDHCVNPPGYGIGNVGGARGASPYPGTTRKVELRWD